MASQRRKVILGGLLGTLPVCGVVALCFCLPLRQPYWTEPDPDYQYLLSAMNMARFTPAGYNHHPGITVKLLGAVVLRVTHLLFGTCDLMTDVLLRPEAYLTAINVTTIVLTGIVLFWLGAATYQATGALALGLLAQLSSVVVMGQLVYHQLKYDAEPTLYLLSICLGILCISILREGDTRAWLARAVGCGVVIALGTAAKLNFGPLAIVPLIALPRLRWKTTYLLATALTMTLVVVLVWREVHELKGPIIRSLGSGAHGGGPTRIPLAQLLAYLHDFVRYEKSFFIAVGVSATLCALSLCLRLSRVPLAHPRALPVALAILAGVLAQVAVVAKNKLTYYMMPAMGLAGPLLVLSMAALQPRAQGWRLHVWRLGVILVSFLTLGPAFRVEQQSVRNWLRGMASRRTGTEAFFVQLAPRLQGSAVIHDAMVMSQAAALSFGNAGYNQDHLRRLYPADYIYAGYLPRPDPFYSWSKPILAEDIIVRHTNVLLLFRSPLNYVAHNLPTLPLELVASGSFHLAYTFPSAVVARIIAERKDALTIPNEVSVRYVKHTNLNYLEASHGTPRKPVLTWGPAHDRKYAEFELYAPTAGTYRLSIIYASGGHHPLDVYVNGQLTFANVCSERTGGYDVEPWATNLPLGKIVVTNGPNIIRLEAATMPCLAGIRID